MARDPSERGSITAFVVVVAFAVMLCGGLVFDGARLVAARSRAADLAQNAARAGAQEIVGLRSGEWQLDPERAAARSRQYLGEHGVAGDVRANDESVTVTVQVTTEMVLLGVAGVGSRTSAATRTIVAVDR